jgi:hypothetical protein
MPVLGRIINRTVVLDEPLDWPDGTEVAVNRVEDEETVGLREEDWPTTEEGIENWLRWYDSIEPLNLTPEDDAAMQAAWKAQRDFERVTGEDRRRKIEKLFE